MDTNEYEHESTLVPKLHLGTHLPAAPKQCEGGSIRSWSFLGLALTAILFASTAHAAPEKPQPNTQPLAAPQGTPVPITVSLPIDSLATTIPASNVYLIPVTTTNIDAGLAYVGFQGDFLFDETVCTFSDPFVEAAGLTATGNWSVLANVLPGSGPIRTFRVSGFTFGGLTLSGSGTLYNLRMVRTSNTIGASTALTWQPSPNNFIFIDADINTHSPNQANGLITIAETPPTPTATATATVPASASPTPSAIPFCASIITQSTSQSIAPLNSVSCNDGTTHTDNSYWRAFNLQDIGTCGPTYLVTFVSFGVESVNQTQPVTVRLYTNNGAPFPGGTRTQIGTTTISVTPAQAGTVVTTPFSAAYGPGTDQLVMELFTPNGQAAGNLFFVGSNTEPQTGPSYISAADCGITEPTDLATIGFPNMHIVFSVQGFCEGTPCPSVTPTATATGSPTPSPTLTPPTTILVTNLNDSGPGSLRQALFDAQDGDTVTFDPALNGNSIMLTTGELVVNKSLTITGPGPDLLTISRNGQASRIFHLLPGVDVPTVTIEGLTITNGNPGGIFNDQATLTINNCNITGNSSGLGGGIASESANLTITNSTISNNQGGSGSSGGRGGISVSSGSLHLIQSTVRNNGGVLSAGGIGFGPSGTLTITDSTISNNGASAGGGIVVSGTATAEIRNSTISGNTAVYGAAIEVESDTTIRNCTISGNTAPGKSSIYVLQSALHLGDTIMQGDGSGPNIQNDGGTVTSLGYNLSSDNGSGFLTGPGDQLNIDPSLGPLQNNGGLTFTHALLPGSPAINTGDPSFTPPPQYDQRGIGYDRVIGGRIDIGSFEVQTIQPTPTATATLTASPTPTPTATATGTPAPPGLLANISTRLHVGTGDNIGIGGFIINGTGQVQVVVRGLGPSLGQQGVPDFLADPYLELHDINGVLAQNDNWRDDPAVATQLTKLGLAPTNDSESALIATLQPGAYTAHLIGSNAGTGTGLVEVYDVDQTVPLTNIELANISTRGFVETGDNVMIGGFIISGQNSTHVAVRGVGPSLAAQGITNLLADPTLELRDSNGALLVFNDNWQDDPVSAAALTSIGLGLSNSNESGIYTSVTTGAYTAILAGSNGLTGVALVEVYNLH